MFKTVRFSALNVALWYVVVSVAVLAVFATPIWYVWHSTIAQGRTEQLQSDAQRLTNIFTKRGGHAASMAIEARVGSEPSDTRQILLLADPSFVKQAGNLPA